MTKKTDLLATLEVRDSTIHGRGVFAMSDIAAGAHIGRYGGRRLPADSESPHLQQAGLTYLFALSDGSSIDGSHRGNATRYINHSCQPNCEAVEMRTRGRLDVVIEATSSIGAGQELLLDYALVVTDDDLNTYDCRCGTTACRGTMVGLSQAKVARHT